MNITLNLSKKIQSLSLNSTKNSILRSFYGDDNSLLEQKQKQIIHFIYSFLKAFPGEPDLSLLRVPARINLMGVHIDHQGGYTNYITLNRETLFCFSPRNDDQIIVKNIDPNYPDFSFSIQSAYPSSLRGNWPAFIQKPLPNPGFWGNYIQSAAFRLQEEYPNRCINGMNLLMGSNIPPNAGLSSSSTLVVGTMMALVQINQVPLKNEELIDLCGTAEWYSGTRGGSGDHAAMLLGKRNYLLNAGFKPFQYRYFPLPSDIDVLLIHSGIKSHKATNSKKIFNSRVAAYAVSYLIFLEKHPEFKNKIQYLRDISPETLNLPLADFYRLIKAIPETMDQKDLVSQYPHLTPEWERICTTYQIKDEQLPLREVFLFGICEYQRACKFPEFLHSGQLNLAGELMDISHNGDRVTCWSDNKYTPYHSPYQDDYLEHLAQMASLEPINPSANLMFQPGGYRCSIPEIDHIADYCKQFPEILGAGLTGAGLGGAVIALIAKDKSQPILVKIREFLAQSLNPDAFSEICQPSEGATFIL